MPQLVASPMPFASPNRETTPMNQRLRDASGPSSSTVRLACLSPNGRSVHTFVVRNSVPYIESYRLPLAGTVEGDIDATQKNSMSAVVRTRLPERVRSALDLYPAMELLSVDVDGSAQNPRPGELRKLPKLCLYTKKDVFLLELGYSPSGVHEVEGQVLSVTEPFERDLLGTSTSTNIIRIRQAPQQHSGYSLMCPPECMAMLTHDASVNTYSLSLYHGKNTTTTPVCYGAEQIEERLERVTDFCFCQSNTLALLSSFTVAFLKGSGEVLVATPVLFRGTVVPRGMVIKTLEYIDAVLKECQQNSPRWRQYRVAKQYVVDAFPDDGRSHFLTAQTLSAAFEWPVQVQGPVLLAAESDDFETSALAIEHFFAGDLVGLAVGHAGDVVEFGILSPSTLVPRFQHESRQDTYDLDQQTKRGASVCRVDLRDDETDHGPQRAAVGLIRDPIIDTVVHYVTPSSIRSVSTNTLKITANKVRQQPNAASVMFSPPSKRRDAQPRTSAWSCFDMPVSQSQDQYVAGAVVSGDVHLGHTMISMLSTGSMVAVNLTEARQLQEMEATTESQSASSPTAGSDVGDRLLRELQDTPALVDIVKPLIEDVIKGISGMAKVVGTATATDSISPEALAAAVAVKQRCDKEILLPILEIGENLKLRSKELQIMYANQMSQLETLKENVKKLKEQRSRIEEKAAIVRENAASLAQRSASALQSSTDLLPTITQAEYDYFQELKRLDARVKAWEQELDRLKLKTSTLVGEEGGFSVKLASNAIDQFSKIQKVVDAKLQGQRRKIREIEDEVDDLAVAAGVDRIALDPVA